MSFYYRHVRPILESLRSLGPVPKTNFSEIIAKVLADPILRERLTANITANNQLLHLLQNPQWWNRTFCPPCDEDGNELL